MANNNIEIEVKFPLINHQEVVDFLNNNAEVVKKDVFQKDTYFTPAHRDFFDQKYPYEWLRLRESAKGMELTYKHFFPEGAEKNDYCDEFEVKIDSAEKMTKIFDSLDFKGLVVVEKNRDVWLFKEVEISIDNVKDLGCFIELETTGHFANPKEGKDYLYEVLKELKAEIGEEDFRGYPFRVAEKLGYKF